MRKATLPRGKLVSEIPRKTHMKATLTLIIECPNEHGLKAFDAFIEDMRHHIASEVEHFAVDGPAIEDGQPILEGLKASVTTWVVE